MVPLGLLAMANWLLTFQVGAYGLLGLLPLGVGTALMFWVVFYFALVGKGTPAPFDPPKRLTNDRFFCYVRTPMYLGALLVLLGEALLFHSMVKFFCALSFWIFFHLLVVNWKEPRLSARFGEAYAAYVRVLTAKTF